MIKVVVFNIRFDLDRGQPKNPQRGKVLENNKSHSEYVLEYPDTYSDQDIENNVADDLSDACGFCVYGFDWKRIYVND